MCVHDHFIGDPNKPQYIDADDIEDDIQYISDEDTFFLEHIEDPSNPEADFIFGNLDVDDDDDDDDPVYDPADEFVDFLSDSEDETSIYEGILGRNQFLTKKLQTESWFSLPVSTQKTGIYTEFL